MYKRYFITMNLLFMLVLCICTGCSAHQERKYTLDELDNLAQIEIYSAETNKLIGVISDEEMLYQYNQCSFDSLYSPENQEELGKAAEGLKEAYYIDSYKYPVSRFGSKELEKNITITIYENSNVIKMAVSEDSIKSISLPQEFLTFYYEMSDEDKEFYHSLIEYYPTEGDHASDAEDEPKTGDFPPMITIHGKNYVAPYMPVDELPDGYEYIGDLTEEAANDTGLAGCKMYAIRELDSFPDFYLYQECGTPIDEDTVDTTQRQWAYVQWICPGT